MSPSLPPLPSFPPISPPSYIPSLLPSLLPSLPSTPPSSPSPRLSAVCKWTPPHCQLKRSKVLYLFTLLLHLLIPPSLSPTYITPPHSHTHHPLSLLPTSPLHTHTHHPLCRRRSASILLAGCIRGPFLPPAWNCVPLWEGLGPCSQHSCEVGRGVVHCCM